MMPPQPGLKSYFREIVVVDFEFLTHDDGSVEVRCMCARELTSEREHRLWIDGPVTCPYRLGNYALIVAHSAGAELSSHAALGWAAPVNLLDTRVEFVAMTAGVRMINQGTSLSEALKFFNLPYLLQEEKDEMRALAMVDKRNNAYTAKEREDLLDYCMCDVDGAVRLLKAMEPQLCR